jgi:hypothetical protein
MAVGKKILVCKNIVQLLWKMVLSSGIEEA